MTKIAIVITSRASLARVQTVLEALASNPAVNLRIVLAGGALLHHYGDIGHGFAWPVAHRVYSTLAGNTLSTTAAETGLLATYLAPIFRDEAPDMVVTIADRHETMATAIAASYQHIPLAHIQGGEYSGSIDDKVRNAVTMLADWHFPATVRAARNILVRTARNGIYCLGCPSIDLAARAEYQPERQNTILILQHPVTNESAHAAAQIDETFAAVLSDDFDGHDILWLWPGQDAGSDDLAKRIREHRERDDLSGVVFKRHLPAHEFLSILRSCACLVGNSSVGVRECAYLGTPTVNIGTRQQNRERAGNVIDVGYDRHAIRSAIHAQLGHGRYPSSRLYGDGTAGASIAHQLVALCRHPVAEGQQGVSGEVAAPVPG